MLIRQAVNNDINRIIELLKQVNKVHVIGRPDIYKETSKYQYDDLKALLDNHEYYIVVAEDEIVEGYAIAITKEVKDNPLLNDHLTLYIDDLCVDESSRGKGIGTMLYNHLVQYAKKNNYDDITLNVWSFNESAKSFYEKCGLTPQRIIMEQKIK